MRIQSFYYYYDDKNKYKYDCIVIVYCGSNAIYS